MEKIMKYFWPVTIAVAICFIVGIISSRFQSEALVTWYPYLEKPAITPPAYVFPIAWSIIYLCMGASLGLAWYLPERLFKPVFRLFTLQLILNFSWSLFFFALHSPLAGFINILLLDAIIIAYIVKTSKVKAVSAWLFAPYLVWLAFATYLNGYIMVANW